MVTRSGLENISRLEQDCIFFQAFFQLLNNPKLQWSPSIFDYHILLLTVLTNHSQVNDTTQLNTKENNLKWVFTSASGHLHLCSLPSTNCDNNYLIVLKTHRNLSCLCKIISCSEKDFLSPYFSNALTHSTNHEGLPRVLENKGTGEKYHKKQGII